MKLRVLMLAAGGTLALQGPVGAAGTPSSLALDPITIAAVACPEPEVADTRASGSLSVSSGPRSGFTLESVRWRPRRWRDSERTSYGSRATGLSQLHAGFFASDGDQATEFLAGFRGGVAIDENIQFGAGIDWAYRSDRQTEIVSHVPLPGGGSSERRVELSRSSANTFPIMALLQVSPALGGDIRPYFGIGGGYEVLFLSADDFTTGEEFDATYGGWGWQAWGGVSIPLSATTHLTTEVFRNQSEVERDVDDPVAGVAYREIVNLDGTGMRFGLSFGF